MSELITRENAKRAICECCYMYKYIGEHYKDCKYYPCDDVKALNAIPSAEAVSMEEHVKELNDLASAWKNKFINAEKRTEEIYDETMAKVANECKECKERLWNLRPSADAEQVTGKLDSPCGSSVTGDSEERKEQKSKLESADATCATCADRAMCIMSDDGNWKACKDYRPSAEAVQGYTEWLEKIIVEAETFEWLCDDATDKEGCEENCKYDSIQAECLRHLYEVDNGGADAEAVQGEWIEVEVLPEVYDIEGVKTWGSKMQCDQCGFRHTAIEGRMAQYNYCPNCGARMKGGAE